MGIRNAIPIILLCLRWTPASIKKRRIARAPFLMITEGLLLYLPTGTVESVALEAKEESSITHWISDIFVTL